MSRRTPRADSVRVLFAAHSFPRFEGDAAGSFLLRLAQALRDEDVNVRVVAPAAAGLARREQIGGISVRRFRYAPARYETLAYTGTMAEDVAASWSGKLAMAGMLTAGLGVIASETRAHRADLVHAHWWFPAGVSAAAASMLTHTPLVTTSHGSDIRLLLTQPAAAPLARFVLDRSTVVTCVSEWLARGASSFTRVPPVVAPMPVDVQLFQPGGPRDPARLLFVGRLMKQKGGELAVRALARMRQKHATLAIVGAGAEQDRILGCARELGVQSRVSMLGPLRQDALAVEYRRSGLLIVPSTDEGLGLVAVEAQLCETPAVAFASGGLTDVVNENTGILVPVGDVDALAHAADSIVASPQLGEKLGRAGRLQAMARFSPIAAARQYAGIYRAALERDAA